MIDVVRTSLEDAVAAAILRPVSAEWEAVTPTMRRLEIAAGPSVAEQCERLGELPVGSAVITAAGALPAQFMVHAVIRAADEAVSANGVRRALQNSLRRLSEWAIDSVAMPPLGTGAGNLDAEDAAQTMLPVLVEHMNANAHPARVAICVETDYEHDAFERAIARHASGARGSAPDDPGRT